MCGSQKKALRRQFSSAILINLGLELRPWSLCATPWAILLIPNLKVLNAEAQNPLSTQAPTCPRMKMKTTGKIRKKNCKLLHERKWTQSQSNQQTIIDLTSEFAHQGYRKDMDHRIRSTDNRASELAQERKWTQTQSTDNRSSVLAHQGCRAVEQKSIFNFKGKDS